MRVITGTARGRRLISPEGENVRPTADKVKEALFSSIQFDVEGRRALDLFAGSGQLGIEALSRGAESCVFTDLSRTSVALVKKNVELCSFEDSSKILCCDGISYLRTTRERFDLIFVDPPYDAGLYEPVLNTLNSVDNLSDGGIIICEARRETELPELPAPYRKGKEYRYGKVKICIYTKESQL